MSTTIEKWKSELAVLAPEERAEIAHFLLNTLDGGEDHDVEAAWDAELERRCAEIRSGEAPGRPAHEVFARIREKYS